jgi:pimeloyl-ACP methyl ester carboxylesterase
MTMAIVAAGLVGLWLGAAAVPEGGIGPMDPSAHCHIGAYALGDGRTLAVTGFDGTPRDLEYVFSSGEYGHMTLLSDTAYRLGPVPGRGEAHFPDCDHAEFDEAGQPPLAAHRIALTETDTFFVSDGTRLHGKLVMPTNPKAILVWIQGSDDDPATNDAEWQYLLPQHGIAVFVYDKRGSGLSGGELSADFDVRANDTAAAATEAQRLVHADIPVGVFGGSQGGWIAPLTATKTKLGFVIVGFGLAEGVTAQDRDEVAGALRAAGYGDDVLAKAHEITDASTRIVKSGWVNGWTEFDALRAKYANEPWLKVVEQVNGFTGVMLETPSEKIREMGPQLDKHISFNYDPRPVIETIAPRQLWVLGGSDHTAPAARTIEILQEIQRHKSNLDLIVYRQADHGIVETFQTNGATRRRHPASYVDVLANWINAGTLPAWDDNIAVYRPQSASLPDSR